MYFPLNHEETKLFYGETVEYSIKLQFFTNERCIGFHPQACQGLEAAEELLTDKLHKVQKGFSLHYRKRLYKDMHVVVESPYQCIQIRRFAVIDGASSPTDIGISLKAKEWYSLLCVFNYLKQVNHIFAQICVAISMQIRKKYLTAVIVNLTQNST